jgi:SAM-dependent methyltransferase
MSTEISKQDLQATWEAAATGWAKWEGEFSRHLSEPTETLLDQAGVSAGMRVLDLACGAGAQTLAAAKRVGVGGRVVACDIAAEMLRHLGENAKRAGLANIETLHCAAEDLADGGETFDAAISRLGLMLFPSPQSALGAVQGVLRPGARFAALVFTTPANNPFMAQPMGIMLRHAGKQPPAPGQPGIFALGGEGVLEGILTGRGFADVRSKVVRAPLRLASADDALVMMQEAFGAYRAVIAELSEGARAAAWADVETCLGQFESESGFEAQFEFIIGSGAAPG